MLKCLADRAVAAARFHLLQTSSSKSLIAPLPDTFRRAGGVLSFSTRSRLRQRKADSDEDLDWDEDVDRELPWPERKSRQEAAAAKKKKHRRALHKVVAVANSNAKEFRGTLPSYGDMRAAWVIGKVLSDRAKEADVYTAIYEPRRGEKVDNRKQTIIDTLVDNGIALEFDKSG